MRRSAGFSLVEALVALVVISFGLLGVATMQLKALEGAHVGYRHSLVNLMAIDAQERVWESLGNNCGTSPSLSEINDAWVGYWFDSADLGFTNHVSEISIDSPCVYQVLVSWEELPYSINEEDKNDTGGGSDGNNGNGQKEVDPERSKEFKYIFRVPDFR